MHMGRKLLSALLCAAVLAAGCGLAALADTTGVSYIEYSWNETTRQLTDATATCNNYTVLTSDMTSLSEGWYVARGTLTYKDRLTLSGDVHLILENGCKLTAEQGITVPGNGSLTIYAQSKDNNTMGALEADGYNYNAAIGGLVWEDGGPVEIHGGGIRVTTHSGGAGIGSGYNGAGTVTVYGGEVKATADKGAGLGGGDRGTGTVTIYGGSVEASATSSGAAIGGGFFGKGTVTIHGGDVMASTTAYGSAIGGGYQGTTGTVTINGGSVTASTGYSGAAIGGGQNGTGTVTINGGSVTASATEYGAAIGSGWSGSSTVTINSGGVTAGATGVGAAIGGIDCVVSLGLTQDTDYVYAQSYRTKNYTLTLTQPLRILGGDGQFSGSTRTGTFAGKVVIPASSGATLLIFPDNEDFTLPDDLIFPDNADFTLPVDLKVVGAQAFQGISAGTVLVPAGVTLVGANAFSDSGLRKIRFLGSGTSVDATAFAGCEGVIAYAIPGTDTWRSLGAIPGIIVLYIN